MTSEDNPKADSPPDEAPRPISSNRFAKFEGVIIGRERVFDVVSTIITAIFTVVLALSTVLLWKETKDLRNFAEQQGEDMKASIAEAARSADAMRDVAKALVAEQEAARANLRAYITIGLGGVVPQDKDTNLRYEVRLTVQNVGNTPANKVATKVYADIMPFPLPADFKIPSSDPADGSGEPMGPHQNSFVSAIAPRLYSDEEVHEIQTGTTKLLYVYGIIRYEDTFGAKHHTQFCQVILWLKNGSQMTRNYGNYNEAD
jgi:hypothetical protein